MEKYLLVFNAGYTFTTETKKFGIKFRLMSLPEVLKYEKDAKSSFLAKFMWKYDDKFENDVRQLFLKFKARVIGISQRDLEKTRANGIKIETPGAESFIINPWAPRNAEVEKYFPPKKEEKKPIAVTAPKPAETADALRASLADTRDAGKVPEGLVNIREQK